MSTMTKRTTRHLQVDPQCEFCSHVKLFIEIDVANSEMRNFEFYFKWKICKNLKVWIMLSMKARDPFMFSWRFDMVIVYNCRDYSLCLLYNHPLSAYALEKHYNSCFPQYLNQVIIQLVLCLCKEFVFIYVTVETLIPLFHWSPYAFPVLLSYSQTENLILAQF